MDGWMNGLVDDFMTKSFLWIKKNTENHGMNYISILKKMEYMGGAIFIR